MSLDRATFAERAAAVQRHLERVETNLPSDPAELRPLSNATDAVILHLWQAVQVIIDLATSVAVTRGLGVPPTYGDAFRFLARDGVLPDELAERLARAAGFRNLVVHAYAELDLTQVHGAATTGPADLRAFLRWIRDAMPA